MQKHDIETAICLFFSKAQGIPETVADEIITGQFVNYFEYSQIKAELKKDGFIKGGAIKATAKGLAWAERFCSSLPGNFKQEIETEAEKIKQKIETEKICRTSLTEGETLYINAEIGDIGAPVMKISLYAPDQANAAKIENAIKRDPLRFYKKVMRLIESPEA
jgi:hypothetical protein